MRRAYGIACCALILLCWQVAAQENQKASGIWLDVPYVHQEKEGCGSASLSMILQYWKSQGTNVPPDRLDAEKIQKQLYSKSAHGIYASAMEKYLRESGFNAYAFRGGWSDLKEHLEKGRPLIVGLQPRKGALLHYVVVAGISEEQNEVIVNDPWRGKLIRISRDDFEQQWRVTDFWTLLAVPKS